MKYLRTYTGEDDHTYFEEVDLPFSFERAQGRETDLMSAESIHFRLTPGNMDYDFHTAPRRRLIILLDGGLEVETGHGDKRQFRALDGRDFRSVFINLDDELIADRRQPTSPSAGAVPVLRCYTGLDDRSTFEDRQLPYIFESPSGKMTEELPLKGFQFVEKSADLNLACHQAPQRQVLLCLTGGIEVEVGDGSKRDVRVGDIYFGEDTTGQNHISRALDGQERLCIFAHLA